MTSLLPILDPTADDPRDAMLRPPAAVDPTVDMPVDPTAAVVDPLQPAMGAPLPGVRTENEQINAAL